MLKTHEVTNEDVANIATSAFEGGRFGIAYWCDTVNPVKFSSVPEVNEFPFGSTVWALATNGEIELREFDETDGSTVRLHRLTRSGIVRGIAAAAEHMGLSLKKFVEDCDGPGADLSFQFALFGEEKYA